MPKLPARPHHLTHAVLTALTGGAWGLVWLAVWLRYRDKMTRAQTLAAQGDR